MALFSIFRSKQKDMDQMIPVEVNDEPQAEKADIQESASDEQDKKPQLLTITWGTGMPIDVIFHYIHKDYEEDGYQDALVNSDLKYRETKEEIIINDLKMLFKRITLKYKNDIREVDVMIDNAQKAYALAAAAKLQARKDTFEEHLIEIESMKSRLEANDPEMLTMIDSYQRGFLKGVSAASMNFINNNN